MYSKYFLYRSKITPKATLKKLLARNSTFTKRQIRHLVQLIELDEEIFSFIKAMTPIADMKKGLELEHKLLEVFDEDISNIKCPILAIHSPFDGKVHIDNLYKLIEMYPSQLFYEYPGGGHLLTFGIDKDIIVNTTINFLLN